MDARFERFAIYWLPAPESALAAFGRAWFGEDGAPRDTFGLYDELATRAIRAPSRYRLHATLKAPFRPAAGATATDIGAALDAFCARRRAAIAGPLQFTQFARYLALTPSCASAELDWLAAECVTAFDRFRAPLTAEDWAARGELDGHEAALMEAFGYPYVLSRFAFHVSLAGPLEKAGLDAVEQALAPVLAEAICGDLVIGSLTLLGDPGGGAPFQPISRHRLMPRRAAMSADALQAANT
jgi:hypothetical protein